MPEHRECETGDEEKGGSGIYGDILRDLSGRTSPASVIEITRSVNRRRAGPLNRAYTIDEVLRALECYRSFRRVEVARLGFWTFDPGTKVETEKPKGWPFLPSPEANCERLARWIGVHVPDIIGPNDSPVSVAIRLMEECLTRRRVEYARMTPLTSEESPLKTIREPVRKNYDFHGVDEPEKRLRCCTECPAYRVEAGECFCYRDAYATGMGCHRRKLDPIRAVETVPLWCLTKGRRDRWTEAIEAWIAGASIQTKRDTFTVEEILNGVAVSDPDGFRIPESSVISILHTEDRFNGYKSGDDPWRFGLRPVGVDLSSESLLPE